MDYVILAVLCFAAGGFCVYIGFEKRRNEIERRRADFNSRESQFQAFANGLRDQQAHLVAEQSKLTAAQALFEKSVVTYGDLQRENAILKQDFRNLNLNVRKLTLDHNSQHELQIALNERIQELGRRYLKENVKWIGQSLNPNNYAACKQKLLDVIERCRNINLEVSVAEEATLLADLRTDYERVVRAALEREEQARIKARIREEQQFEREIQRETERAERERAAIEAALARALADAAGQHTAEIEVLKARLAEVEAKQRAISQAQLTKAGFIYVISNMGSFGENVFKIGMTRRLEPMERVRELGGASVPFPFDVHMMISCENAPTLENTLHKRFVKHQVNKTNPRKEFFRVDLESIAQAVRECHGDIEYVADAEALQYQQSLSMSDEDVMFIEQVFDDNDEEDNLDGETIDEIPKLPVEQKMGPSF